jgi:hypothetical protein
MNIPKIINANKILDPLNLNFEKKYPLIDPMRMEKKQTGITSLKLFRRFGNNFLAASP